METTRAKTHIRPPRYTSKGLLEAILLSKKPILARRSPSITSLNESGSTRSSSSASSHRDTPPIRLRVKDHRSTSETRKSYHSLNNVPVVSAASWCVMEGSTGHIVYGHSDQEIKEIASLTKIMTCYLSLKLTLNFKVNLTTVLIISEKAASVTGTSAELRTGDAITLRDLLFGLMLPSGNDAAWALAEYFGKLLCPSSAKPTSHFMAEMNRLSRELGLDNTTWSNPHGLMYKRNLSTARDVCKLASIALRDDMFKSIVGTKTHKSDITNNGITREQIWENTNKLLSKGFEGVKTGVTNKAGPCLCASYKNDTHMIVTLLNSKSMEARWIEAKKLVEWGSIKYLNSM